MTATGAAVSEMLREIKETANIGNPYNFAIEETYKRLGKIRKQFAEIREGLAGLWQSPYHREYKNATVSLRELESFPIDLQSISFENCRSKDWEEIGKRLWSFDSLVTI